MLLAAAGKKNVFEILIQFACFTLTNSMCPHFLSLYETLGTPPPAVASVTTTIGSSGQGNNDESTEFHRSNNANKFDYESAWSTTDAPNDGTGGGSAKSKQRHQSVATAPHSSASAPNVHSLDNAKNAGQNCSSNKKQQQMKKKKAVEEDKNDPWDILNQ